jgi:cephalosporin-C deacetylase-like acetyl esterase
VRESAWLNQQGNETMRNLIARRLVVLLILLAILSATALAQDRTGTVQVRVRPDRDGWTYAPGEAVIFHITAVRDGFPLQNAQVKYRVGPEMMAPTVENTSSLPEAGLQVQAGTMKEPGFLRCTATVENDGRTYRGLATAGFAPEKIQPTAVNPADFDDFWNAGKGDLAKIPLDARLTPLPEYGTASVDCFHVNIQNIGSGAAASRLYGILCEPKADGQFPALLNVPGAGVRPYRGLVDMAEKGIITFQIGIHGIPVNLEPSLYESLRVGALDGYNTFGLDNRDRYYYRRVYLGCVRANDFLVSRAKWDGRNLMVTGGSQGGALSIVTAALDPRIKGLAAYYPALSDVTGYLQGRAGGWPHMFRSDKDPTLRIKEKVETSRYYDVVNFARRVRVPGFYTWGYNDETCPPTSMFSAYNVIQGPKKLMLALETGHNNVPEQVERVNRWIELFLKTGEFPK